MALSTCLAYPRISPKIDCRSLIHRNGHKTGINSRLALCPQGLGTVLFGQFVPRLGAQIKHDCSFLGGGSITIRSKEKGILSRKTSGVCRSWLSNSELASTVITLGTAAVLPFYTLMVAAPKAELTKKTMRSNILFVVLGLLYTYLLWLSWTPDTLRMMFGNKYWLPELQGIAKMFSSEMTLASAWIHLLTVDLFAARQVYHDGLENEVETRHSVSFCMLFCPIGILSHVITKKMTNRSEKTKPNDSII